MNQSDDDHIEDEREVGSNDTASLEERLPNLWEKANGPERLAFTMTVVRLLFAVATRRTAKTKRKKGDNKSKPEDGGVSESISNKIGERILHMLPDKGWEPSKRTTFTMAMIGLWGLTMGTCMGKIGSWRDAKQEDKMATLSPQELFAKYCEEEVVKGEFHRVNRPHTPFIASDLAKEAKNGEAWVKSINDYEFPGKDPTARQVLMTTYSGVASQCKWHDDKLPRLFAGFDTSRSNGHYTVVIAYDTIKGDREAQILYFEPSESISASNVQTNIDAESVVLSVDGTPFVMQKSPGGYVRSTFMDTVDFFEKTLTDKGSVVVQSQEAYKETVKPQKKKSK